MKNAVNLTLENPPGVYSPGKLSSDFSGRTVGFRPGRPGPTLSPARASAGPQHRLALGFGVLPLPKRRCFLNTDARAAVGNLTGPVCFIL